MATFDWRKFNFFNLKSSADKNQFAAALNEANISCVTYGNGQIFVGDSTGNVHIFRKDWSFATFKAHDDAILLIQFCRQTSLLITIGNEDMGDDLPSFKVWNISKVQREGAPNCVRTTKIVLQKPTAMGISENGQVMAIGFDKGGISLYKGDLGRDRSRHCKTLSGGTSAISGIEFKTSGKTTQMYVCSDSGVLLYSMHSQQDKENKTVLETMSGPFRCCAMQTSGQKHFMVGRDDAIYCYTPDGKGPCYALEGQKSILEWFRTHLLTVFKPNEGLNSQQKYSTLTVIDIQNNFIVFSTPIDSVAAIVIEFGNCYVVTYTKEVYQLDEKDLQSKLNLLFKKNLYDIAVRIAKSNQCDGEDLAEICRQYGDHMYGKSKFNEAVEQYVKTIGYLEPSYVIRKFLDSRHIHCLTSYLEELHRVGRASADHTTLLLNCFTRLDETNRLKDFLQNDRNPDLMFDLDAAIKVCRNASEEQALALAKRNNRHHYSISILIEDLKDYKQALTYIEMLDFQDAEENLMKYGCVLMEQCPKETTALLKKVCMDFYNNSKAAEKSPVIELDSILDDFAQTKKKGSPENFLHLFGSADDHLIDFLEYFINNFSSQSNNSKLVLNTLIEKYLKKWSKLSTGEQEPLSAQILDLLQKHYDDLDQNHILILCKSYDFHLGIMWIYEEEKLYHLIVRYFLKHRDYNRLMDTCKRLGALQPCLWLQTLTGLRNDKNAPANLMSQILAVILQQKLQSPLQVLNSLAVEDGPQLLSVRGYFKQIFKQENESFKQEDERVDKYRTESLYWKKHIKEQQEEPVEFKSTICNDCNKPLAIPCIYFMCQHSFHQDCLKSYSENEKDCPVCHTKNQLDSPRAQPQDQDNGFHTLMDRSGEPFSFVAEYFGRGLFNKIVVFDENETNHGITDPVQVPQFKQPAKEIPPTKTYGPGAEAQLRVNEVRSARQEIPVSEGRMRLQENRLKETNYSSSLEANIEWGGKPPSTRDKTPKTKEAPPPKLLAKPVNSYPKGKDPFGDEDADEKPYDKEKNPFENADNVNNNPPPSTYDKRLNPFE